MLAETVESDAAGTVFPTQDDSLCTTIVAGRQSSESLLSRSILGKRNSRNISADFEEAGL